MLAEGADVNGRNQSGQTALILASLMGRVEVVHLLMEAGADASLRDNQNLTALEWSQRRGFPDVAQLIANAQSKQSATAPAQDLREGREVERAKGQEFGPASTAILKTLHARRRQSEASLFKSSAEANVAEPPPSKLDLPLDVDNSTSSTGTGPVSEERPIEGDRVITASQPASEEAAENVQQDVASTGEEERQVRSTTPLEKPAVPTGALSEIGTATIPDMSFEPSAPSHLDAATMWGLAGESLESAGNESTPTQPLESQPVEDSSIDEETPLPFTKPLDSAAAFQTQPDSPAVPLETLRSIDVSEPTTQTSVPKGYSPGSITSLPPDIEKHAPNSTSAFARPTLWVLIISTLLVSAILTYLITNRFTKPETAATTTAVSTGASGTGPNTPAKPPANSPVLAGAIADAATSVPEADYPAEAKSKGISGPVVVVVRVSRAKGEVISARALNGDRQLRSAAEAAAREAKFATEKLSDDSNVVSGTITYLFGVSPTIVAANPEDDTPVTGGALQGAGLNVPKPSYPENVRGERKSPSVVVVVRVNKMGEVIAARPLNGDGQFRTAAVNAARKATFSRDKLPRESKVTSGTIIYNFKAPKASPTAATANPTNTPSPAAPSPRTGSATVSPSSAVVGGDLAGKELDIPLPDYPAALRGKGVVGKITILVRVNKQGKVISWRTLEGDKAFREAALKAAKRATFSPQKLGDITSVLGTITYTFKS